MSQALKRVRAEFDLARKQGIGICLFLGAGCSIKGGGSRDVSTTGVMKAYLNEIEDEAALSQLEGVGLYKEFVNHWDHLGDEYNRGRLNEILSDIQPTKGHTAIRDLVEAGYISHIITTNFDEALEKAFEGLCYTIYPLKGEETKVSSGRSLCTIIKPHGDIINGKLLFSPHELDTLPEHMEIKIREASHRPTLTVGFSGQDRGVMSVLWRGDGYAAYWASPRVPVAENTYETKMLFQFLSERKRSDHNILSGEEHGYFDSLFQNLRLSLIGKTPPHLSFYGVASHIYPWDVSRTFPGLDSNRRIRNLVDELLSVAELISLKTNWQVSAPYYVNSYEDFREACLHEIQAASKIGTFAHLLSNEFYNLLLVASIDALIRQIGGAFGEKNDVIGFFMRLRAELAKIHCGKEAFDDGFWAILNCMSNTAIEQDLERASWVYLNHGSELVMGLHKPDVDTLRSFLQTILVSTLVHVPALSLSLKKGHPSYLRHIMLKNLADRRWEDGKCHLRFRDITADDFDCMIENLIIPLCPELEQKTTGAYKSRFLQIDAELSHNSLENIDTPKAHNKTFQIIDRLKEERQRRYIANASSFPIENNDVICEISSYREIKHLFAGELNGAFLIGPSGSGKSTFAKWLISQEEERQITVFPFNINEFALSSNILQLLFKTIGIESQETGTIRDQLVELDTDLMQQGRKLVIFLDGLNEGNGSFDELLETYQAIKEFGLDLYSWKIRNIKIIATCRDASFRFLLMEGGLPSAKTFLYMGTQNKEKVPYIELNELSQSDRETLICSCFPKRLTESAIHFANAQDNQRNDGWFTHPFQIILAGEVVQDAEDLSALTSFRGVFNKYIDVRLNRIGDAAVRRQVPDLLKAYFSLSFSKEQTAQFTYRTISENNGPESETIILALQDVGILTGHANGQGGLFAFRHDRIHEYFLGRYLIENPDAKCANGLTALEHTIEKARFSDVSIGALVWFFGHCITENGETITTILRQLSEEFLVNNQGLSTVLVDTVEEQQKPEVTLKLIMNGLSFGPTTKTDYWIIELILTGLQNSVLYSAKSNLAVLIEAITASNLVSQEHKVRAYLLLTQEKIKFQGMDDATYYLQKAKMLKDNISPVLRDLVNREEAVWLRRSGKPAQAATILEEIFLKQVSKLAWNDCALTLWEYSSALREITLFDEALKVLNKYLPVLEKNKISPLSLISLKLRKAV
ncbi:MAG: SIR2 family protein, partial [Methylocystaceae bacterium]|nr:SIR2 family protein [Methylocystaceae bacterium]